MLKKLVVIGAFAGCSAAQAEVHELRVVYQGFYDAYAQAYNPTLRLEAFFDVDDVNRDGTYSYDEVRRFSFGPIDYRGVCGNDPIIDSCLSSFTYTPGSVPSFTARYHVHDELFPWGENIVAGQYWERYSYRTTNYRWNWTPETRTSVLPVPEPAQYGMLAIGLAGMAALARRRRRG